MNKTHSSTFVHNEVVSRTTVHLLIYNSIKNLKTNFDLRSSSLHHAFKNSTSLAKNCHLDKHYNEIFSQSQSNREFVINSYFLQFN